MATPAVPTNRAQRRASGGAGARRKPVIAGSLLTVGGLLGAYLGYIRPPAAFAVTGCPSGATLFNPVGATPSTDLQTMIDDPSRVGDTICITGGFTMDADITITTSVTLIGNDSVTYPTIIGTGFDIGVDLDGAGATVTVKYLKLHNLDYALALCGEAGDQLTVTNSTISDSTMYALRVRPGSNGPVTCTDSNANIIIQDSTITGGTNQIQQNGDGDFTFTRTTLSNMSGYLYILDTGDLTLDNCDLTNIGYGNGQPALVITDDSNDGLRVYTDTVSISDSDFSGNDYGAIEVRGARNLGSLTITGSSFTVNGGGSNYYATVGITEAGYLSTLTISDSSFTNNTPGIAGTLFVDDSGPNLYIKDTQFTGNFATSGPANFNRSVEKPTGAALYSYGDLKMRNVDFTGNKTIGRDAFPVASAIGVSQSSGPTMDWDDVVVTGNGDTSIDLPAVYIGSGYGTITNSRFSGNLGSGAVKDLRIALNVNNYLPLMSITSTSVSSRSTVSIAPGSVTTVSLTYLDEVPVDNGGGSGGGSTPVADSTPSAAPTTPTQDAISTPASSPVTFADASKVVPSQIESLTPAQVASIPYAQFKDLSPNVFGALTAAQVAALPLGLVRAIRPARMASLTPEAVAGMSGGQLSALRLASVRAMSPAQISAISPEVMRVVAPAFLAQLKPKVFTALGSEVVGALSPEQVAAIRPAALAKLPVRQLQGFTNQQVARLTVKQRAALTANQRRAIRRG